MSWELIEFTLEETSGPVQVFNFEARLFVEEGAGPGARPGQGQGPAPSNDYLEFRGDGIYLGRTKQLRLNREAELAGLIRERCAPPLPPYTPKSKLPHFDASPLVAELTELLRARISAPPVVAPRKERTASPTPALGSVAYMLRWEH